MIDYPFKWELREKIILSRQLWDMRDHSANFNEFLSAELERLNKVNSTELDEAAFRQRQGAIQTLNGLLEMIGNSREMHDTLKQSERQRVVPAPV